MEYPRLQRSYFSALVVLVVLTAAGCGYVYARLLLHDGLTLLNGVLVILATLLFLWIAFGFWTATLGFLAHLLRPRLPTPPSEPAAVLKALPKTAIVMPVFNEETARVFANMAAMYQSLEETGSAAAFDFFVLSDSTHPDIWIEEELAWAQLRTAVSGVSGLYYRRRPRNHARKSGNIADFCQHWGGQYRYVIVLDADSVLEGATLVEMVRRIESDETIGILQVPPVLANHDALFARLQQFSCSVYGDVFTTGLGLWTQSEGNYWGHNAILRLEPFMQSCGLPHLPGPPPLGGEILSHDFVEAAFMLRAGWKVVVATDLRGSYEECPSNLIDFAKRDQRWCQGNLQHILLAFRRGLNPLSRVHLLLGIMSYLSAPLWLLFLALSVLDYVGHHNAASIAEPASRSEAFAPGEVPAVWLLLMLTMALLFLPRLWAFILVVRDPEQRHAHEGALRLGLSVVLESIASMLTAPILMGFHSVFVFGTFLGHTVQWTAQSRSGARLSLASAFRVHAPYTILGLVSIVMMQIFAPPLTLWFAPILLPLVLSVPISIFLSDVGLGIRLREAGLLLVPGELDPPPLLRVQQRNLTMARARRAAAPHPFVQLVLDPALNALHIALLSEQEVPPSKMALDRLRRILLSGGPSRLSRQERLALASSPEALRWLHREAWKDWPLDVLAKTVALIEDDTRRTAEPYPGRAAG